MFVAIIDDSPVVFLGVAALLRPFKNRVRVEQYAGTLPQRGRVDIVLYDPFVPPNTMGRLREINQQTGVPVVAFCSPMTGVQEDVATKVGAAGFLSKKVDGASMLAALEAVAAGKSVPTAPSAPTSNREPTTPSPWMGEREGLSAREAAIVSLIVAGMANQDIAGALYMSIHSVKTHIRSAYRKMGVANRTHAILWGVNHGFQLHAPAARLNDGSHR